MADTPTNEGGLSSIPTAGVPLTVTGGGSRGSLATIVAPKGVIMNTSEQEGILANMQKLADQINNPWRQAQEGIKDISAWTQYGPAKTQAFQAREEARGADRAMLYNIAQQQASLKASQNQAQADLARINQLKQGQPGGAGTTTGGGALPQYVINALNSVNPNDVAAQQAILNNYYKTDVNEATKLGYNPAAGVSKMTFVPEIGQELDMTPPEVIAYTKTGKIPERFGIKAPNAPVVAPPTTTTPSTIAPTGGLKVTSGFGLRTDPITGEVGKLHAGIDLAGAEGTPIPANKPGTVAYAGNANDGFGNKVIVKHEDGSTSQYAHLRDLNVKPGETVDLSKPVGTLGSTGKSTGPHLHYSEKDASGNIIPVSADKISLPAQKAALMSAKTTETGGFVPPYPKPVNSKQVDANMKAEEEYRRANLSIGQKEGEVVAGKSGESQAQMNKLADTAALNTIPAAEQVLAIASDPERSKVLAYLHGGDPIATAAFTAAKRLSKKPANELEEEIITNKFGKQALEDYRFIQNAGMKLGIDFAADVFKGARMGIGLEKMAMGAKGIDTTLPAEVVRRNAQLIRDAGQFQIDKQNMFKEWAKTHGGKMASFDEFEGTPEYVKFRDDAKNRFINTYKGLVKPEGAAMTPAERARQEIENRKKGNK